MLKGEPNHQIIFWTQCCLYVTHQIHVHMTEAYNVCHAVFCQSITL